ncbi:sodium:solute symporter [Paracoccus sp. 1_MG-2023]|uniref:sodium:solute symporter n=1 Tax=unclassified Paracoccus (in: a-proteobacteria) TaxID=2688777 RepID=UPI001C092FA0|nr:MULTISPECIES: sodium:solute symporter [unclassified Paracoccus (in: a-proteobacteria)]MBU2958799.1 sodium:solute symporter [Paracoccus sp. C2R09]MDO6667792.1 sodium:solute symporter [Paracoccus sp. 1_MG-2023]
MGEAKFDLHLIDYAIVAIYFIAIVAHGLHVSRKNKGGAEEYFLAGRSLPWYLIGFSLFASNMSGSSFVGLMGGAYDNGIVIYNYEWTAAFVLILFAIFILPSYLRAKVTTVPEFLEARYDVRSRRAFSLFTILAILFIDSAGALYAGGLVISNVTEYLNLWTAVAVLALVAGIYTILGGLSAVVVTDTVQAILLIVAAAVLFWLGLDKIGGWEAMFADLPEDKQHLILPANEDFLPWTGIWGVILLGFYYFAINQFVVQRTLGARDLKQGQIGAIFAGFLKLPNLFLLILPGLIALKLYPDLETPDLAFPTLAFELMPIGIRGLIMAALIAAIMSSLDSAMNSAATLVVKDFVLPMKAVSEKRQVQLGRLVTGAVMIFGALYAPMIAGFESLFSYFQSSLSYVVPTIVVVYILGLFIPWLNGNGAFWTIVFGLVVGVPLFIAKEVTSIWADIGLPDIHYTIMSSIMMAIGIALHMGISAATRRPAKENTRDLVWSMAEAKDAFLTIERPMWKSRILWSALLSVSLIAVIVWFW